MYLYLDLEIYLLFFIFTGTVACPGKLENHFNFAIEKTAKQKKEKIG